MSLPHAILGMLRRQPMTGYDLKTRCFDESIAHFWPADQAQIYRTLERMAADGWVESRLDIQEGRPNRKEYRLTERGEAELERWLREPQQLPASREPFLVQLFFADRLEPGELDALLVDQAGQHEARLARYRAVPLPPVERIEDDRELLVQRLTLELGLALEQAHLDWLERARAALGGGRPVEGRPES